MISKEFFLALEDLQVKKGIDQQVFITALEAALAAACKKNYGDAVNVIVRISPERYEIKTFIYRTVVEEVEDEYKEISLEEAKKIKKTYKLGDIILKEFAPKNLSRIAVQSAKNIIVTQLQQAEKSLTYQQFVEKENELLVGIVSRAKEDGTVFVEIGKNQMEGVLSASDLIPGEKFTTGEKIKVYVKKVKEGAKGTSVMLSRTAPGFIKRLFENEVPEIRSGIVVIQGIVREAGFRTKMAVYSTDPQIDPVGACVGAKGVRVNAIVNEIGGEKIDIIPYSEDVLDFIARALSPAKVIMVQADEENKEARVIVPDDKLSLAIGKEGQNARLAARLTGWKIDVKSYSAAVAGGLYDNEDGESNETEDSETPHESEQNPQEDAVNLDNLDEMSELELDDNLLKNMDEDDDE